MCIASLEKKLYESWLNSPYPSTKINTYFPIYAKVFGHLVDKNCVFIETGVLNGGSLFMWRNWLGPNARIIGIDLNPEAIKWRDHGFEIYIGDQSSPEFWQHFYSEVGEFDALLDDGGHQSFQQIVTVLETIRSTKKECVIAIEDTFTSFMRDFKSHGKFSFLEFAKSATDLLVARSFCLYKNRFRRIVNTVSLEAFRNVYSINFFNGIVTFNINPLHSIIPHVIHNHPPAGASDFRHNGINYTKVVWPYVYKNRLVKIKGSGLFFSIKNIVMRMVPERFKCKLRDNYFLKKYYEN